MVNVLYAVAAFTCGLIALILPARIAANLKNGGKTEKSFLILIRWTTIFCFADGAWGIAASELIMNDTLLLVMSCVFHSLAAITPLFWLNFVIVYLGNNRSSRIYLLIADGMLAVELILIIINLFAHWIFYVDENGIYCSAPVRRLLFYIQYATYVAIGLYSVVNLIRERASAKSSPEGTIQHNYQAVLIFVASPILCGIFQLLYPDAPAYSIGYTIGVCAIDSFVLTDMLHKQYLEKARTEAINQSKTEFLFTMSHDIRTPMNAILGYTDIGIRHCDSPKQSRENFRKIKIAGGHLLNLINDILEMSRIEAGKLDLKEVPLDLRKALAGVELMSQSLATAKSIDFRVEFQDFQNPYVYADELHINEVLINLISMPSSTPRRGAGCISMHASSAAKGMTQPFIGLKLRTTESVCRKSSRLTCLKPFPGKKPPLSPKPKEPGWVCPL